MNKNLLRTILYIDGFNVYYGLKDAKKFDKYGDYRWLNYQQLAQNILLPHQKLEYVKYFTARIKGNPIKQKRQNDYLEALNTLPKIKIYYGNYLIKRTFDRNLNTHFEYPVEKKTDVNIATQLLIDAFLNNFDCAYIISGDSDLLPAIEAVRNHFSGLTLIACFPPRRNSVDLKAACHGVKYLKEKIFKKSLLPDEITKSDGYIIRKPSNWGKNSN